MRPHLRSINCVEMMMSKRRSQRSFELAGGSVFAAASEQGDGVCSATMAERRGALLLANWRGVGAWMKQISKLSGAWRHRGRDGLTCGGSASYDLHLARSA